MGSAGTPQEWKWNFWITGQNITTHTIHQQQAQLQKVSRNIELFQGVHVIGWPGACWIIAICTQIKEISDNQARPYT
jgi:hypothetical protein